MDIVLRATIIFFALYVVVRVLGKRELAQLTPFELIMLIVLGDLVQQGVTQNDLSLTGAAMAVGTMVFWTLALSWITYLSPRAESLLDGEPRVMVRDGQIAVENARRARVTRTEIFSEMRLAGIAQLKSVAWAILEPHGKMSFIERRASSDEARPEEARPDDDEAP